MSAYLKTSSRPVLLPADSSALRAEPPTQLVAGQLALFTAAGSNFRKLASYDAASTATDDGSSVWKPSALSGSDPGRWLVVGGENEGAHSYVKRDASGNIVGAGGSGPDFPDPVLHVNDGGALPVAGLYGLSVNMTVGANRRGIFYDAAASRFVVADDTLGDDTTISAYLPFRSLSLLTTYVQNAAGGTASAGLVRMASGDEIRARVGSEYRLAAALTGPVLAFGDAAAATTTIDAASTLRATVASGTIDLRAGGLTIKDALGSATLLDVSASSAAHKWYGTSSVYAAGGGALFFETDPGASLAQLNGRLKVLNAAGSVTLFDADPATPAVTAYAPLTVRVDAISTTKTFGLTLANDTVSGTQVSPMLNFRSFHSGGTRHNFAWQQEVQSASRQKVVGYYGTGTSAPTSALLTLDNSDPNYGVALTASTLVAGSGGNGFRLANNGGGMKEDGSSNAIFQNAASGSIWSALSSTSTGSSSARFQFTLDAGTPTVGRALRVGYGSGSFSTELFGISCATATMGHVFVNGVDIGWNVRGVSGNAITAAIGDRLNVDTTTLAGAVALPAVPSVTSSRSDDIVISDVGNTGAGNSAANNIVITPNGTNKINGAATLTIAVNGGSVVLCHDGDGTNWRIKSGRLL